MLLAVDVGNTQTHLGVFEGEGLVEHWRFQTRSGATGDELAERIAGLFSLSGMSFDGVDAVCVSSVVPPLGSQFEELTRRYLKADCLTIGPGVKTGMPIRIENPLEVGADRLVNAIGAYERFGEACVSSTSAPASTSTPSPPRASTSAARSAPASLPRSAL